MSEILTGTGLAILLKSLAAGLGFAFNLVLARTLGPAGTGLYFLALTAGTVASGLGRLGLDASLLRFTSSLHAVKSWAELAGVHRQSLLLGTLTSILTAALLHGSAPWLAESVFQKPELADPLRWMAWSVPAMTLVFLQGQALKGLARIGQALTVNGVGVPALSLAVLILVGRSAGLQGAIWAFVIAAVAMAALGAWLWRRATPFLRDVEGRFEGRVLLESCLPAFVGTSMMMVMNRAPILAIGLWGDEADTGVFGAAQRTAILTSMILASVNSVAAPKFSALYRLGDMQALAFTARKCATLMTLIAGPIVLLFVCFPETLMGFFGQEFRGGGRVLTILALAQFVHVVSGSVGYLLMMSGHERGVRNAVLLAMLVCLTLLYLLVPTHGIVGAAWASAAGLIVFNAVCFCLVRARLGFWALPYVGRSRATPE